MYWTVNTAQECYYIYILTAVCSVLGTRRLTFTGHRLAVNTSWTQVLQRRSYLNFIVIGFPYEGLQILWRRHGVRGTLPICCDLSWPKENVLRKLRIAKQYPEYIIIILWSARDIVTPSQATEIYWAPRRLIPTRSDLIKCCDRFVTIKMLNDKSSVLLMLRALLQGTRMNNFEKPILIMKMTADYTSWRPSRNTAKAHDSLNSASFELYRWLQSNAKGDRR